MEKDQSSAEGIYWALTTMTTVGYGDPSPKTTPGRMLAVVVMLVGIGFVAILTGAIAQRFVVTEVEEEAAIEEEIDVSSAAILQELSGIQERLANLESALPRRS